MEFFLSLGVAGFLYLALQISVTVHILLFKEDIKSSIGWMGLVWLAPLLGSVAYIILGINRIKRKALELRNKNYDILTLTGKTLEELIKEIPQNFIQLIKMGYQVHPQKISLYNKVTHLINGDEAYPQMCRAIAAAKEEVLIQSYIFDNDEAGQMFIAPLKQAVKNGAKVKMLIDGVGINYSSPNIRAAARKIKGLEFAVFLPSKSPVNLPFVNLRNHRKMIAIDGQTAFFGGMNVASGNLVKNKPKKPIVDITFKVEGEAVEQMSRVFLEDWIFTGKKSFTPAAFNKTFKPEGNVPVRILPDGPDSDYGKIETLTLGAISCAQQKISIVTPYFLPEENILSALEVAAMRGIEVEIILPKKSNIIGMDYAMKANFNRLIKKGVKIYQSPPPFDHSKLMLLDNAWLFTGSANWDVRSFKLNFESNMECFDMALAKKINTVIEGKKRGCAPLRHYNVPLLKKLRNNAFRLMTPYY